MTFKLHIFINISWQCDIYFLSLWSVNVTFCKYILNTNLWFQIFWIKLLMLQILKIRHCIKYKVVISTNVFPRLHTNISTWKRWYFNGYYVCSHQNKNNAVLAKGSTKWVLPSVHHNRWVWCMNELPECMSSNL